MPIKTVTAAARWNGGTATAIRVGGHEFHMDQPAGQGGTDLGPTPVQYFLASLPGCMSLVGRLVAAEMGISIHSMEFTVDGDIDPDGFSGKNPEARNGLHAIRMEIAIRSDADDATLCTWLDITRKRCPVVDNLYTPPELSFSVRNSKPC